MRLVLVCLVVAAGCGKQVGASHDFSDAMADARGAMRAFTQQLPSLDADIERERKTDPAKAAAHIERAVLPLFDRTIAAMDHANQTGRAYLEAATDEDPAPLAKIRTNLDMLVRQRGDFAGVRDVYAEEAAILKKGPISDADLRRLGQKQVDLMTDAAR